MNLKSYLKHNLVSFFFPKYCQICQSSLDENWRYHICDACIGYISPLSNQERFLFHNEYLKNHIQQSYIYCHFDNHTRPILHELKYNHLKSNGRLMGDLISDHFSTRFIKEEIDVIIPIPLHPIKLKLREYNQAEIIAEQISKRTLIPIDINTLTRTKNTKTQTKLNKKQREKNLNNAFSFHTFQQYKKILLVDDVITTGTTILKINEEIRSKLPNVEIVVTSFATPYFN